MTIKSTDHNYNINLRLVLPTKIEEKAFNYSGGLQKIALIEPALKVSTLFTSVLKNQLSEIDLFFPLGNALKELIKKKIESLNLFYDDLPEVKTYYKLFIEDLSGLYMSRFTQIEKKADPFLSLIAIDQALKNVGVHAGLSVEGFQELFDVLFGSDELLGVTTYSFSSPALLTKRSGACVPVNLSLILKIHQAAFDRLRDEVLFLLESLNESIEFPAGLDKSIFHADWNNVRLNLEKVLKLIPVAEEMDSLSLIVPLSRSILQDFHELGIQGLHCLKAVETALSECETGRNERELLPIKLFMKTGDGTNTYDLTYEQLVSLKDYYVFQKKFSSYFDHYVFSSLKQLKSMFKAFVKWRNSLSNKQVEAYLNKAVKDLSPEDHQVEADKWLSELLKEKAVKAKKGPIKKKTTHGPAKAPGKKTVAEIQLPETKKIQVSYPHPVLFEMVSSVSQLGQSSIDALKQAYVYETDLKWIEKQVKVGVSHPAALTGLFLSTIRTSYLYLEQLFRSYQSDLSENVSLERTHDLYSFGSKMTDLHPELIRDLFLGNFWVDYPEDHLSRWKKAGAVIDHSVPGYLERSERAYKKDEKTVEPAEILQLIQNVFTTRARWMDLAFKEDAFGTEDLKEQKCSWIIPQLSFKQVNTFIQRLKDQKALNGNSLDRLSRLTSYLEATVKGQSKDVTYAEFSYIVRTSLHLMHLLLESGLENFGEKNNIKISREHHLVKLAEMVQFPLAKKKKAYLKRFFETARHISSYPYDKSNVNSSLVPLILKLDYKANYALHQKERRLFPKIDLKQQEAQGIINSLFNGFTPMLEDLLKSL